MTIAQDKYSYIDINLDGSQTLKGIIEIEITGEKAPTICLYRIHLASRTILLAQLIGSPSMSVTSNIVIIANLIWKRLLTEYKIDPNELVWIEHSGRFSGRSGGIDIRDPFGSIRNIYGRFLLEWNGTEFELDGLKKLAVKKVVSDDKRAFLESDIFGKVNEVTNKLDWKRNINRLDLEYRKDQINSDGSTTIKTIYHWEHPNYPAHCLVRILLLEQKATVIMSELATNIPPNFSNPRIYPINTVDSCALQVINGIYTKYYPELSTYSDDDIIWIYERTPSFTNWNYHYAWDEHGSEFKVILLRYIEGKFDFRYPNIDEYQDRSNRNLNYILVEESTQINFLTSNLFGAVDDSLAELGWKYQ